MDIRTAIHNKRRKTHTIFFDIPIHRRNSLNGWSVCLIWKWKVYAQIKALKMTIFA